MKKLISILVTLALLMTLCVPALGEAPAITKKDMTFYICDAKDQRTLPVYFMGNSDVPYLSLTDYLNSICWNAA